MSWLFPGFLAAGLLAGLPIALHLLRRKPRETVPFPSLRFLGPQILRETKKQRILRWLVLLLRCLAVLLLAAAFARPFFGAKPAATDRVAVIALDNSFSMQAAGRAEVLKKWAEGELAAAGEIDRAGVLLIQPAPRWLVPPDSTPEVARQALREWQPGWQTSRYRPALMLAAISFDRMPARERLLVWAGDQQRLGWSGVAFSPSPFHGVDLRFPDAAPAPERQASLGDLRVRPAGPGRFVAEAMARPLAPAVDKRTVRLFSGERELASREIELRAGEPARVSLAFTAENNAPMPLRAALDPDDLPADDAAYAVLDPAQGGEVLLAPTGKGIDYLAHALAAARQPNLDALRATPLPDAAWPPDAVAALRGEAPFTPPQRARLHAFIAGGGSAWVMLDGSPAQTEWLASLGVKVRALTDPAPLRLRDWDIEHPLMQVFRGNLLPLLGLRFERGWALEGAELIPIARWQDRSVAVAEMETERGRLLITGFFPSRESGSLPVQSAFVPLAHRALTWLGQAGREPEAHVVGQPVALPPGAGEWAPVDSPLSAEPLAASGTIVPEVPGVYRWTSGSASRLFAVNVPADESDLAPWPDAADWQKLAGQEPAPAAEREAARLAPPADASASVWWWLLLAVFILLTLETRLSNRAAF